ncbi:AraC family transcriptional regulator, partial [Paenibacillus sepulcri]|nr:AraC family transcriptional regulator [Paenibacillus sepulcri]
SEPFESWQDWGKRDADAREMLSLSFYNEEQNLFREKLPEPALPLSLLAWKRDIVRQLSCFQWEDAERMLDMLPELQPYPRPALLLNLLADVMFQLNRIRERMGIRTDQEEGEGAGAVLSDCCTLSACVEAIRSSIRNAGKWGGRGNHRKYVIEAVEMYLDEHSFEEISLNGVSALFNMSPAQLSRLYKEEKGLNFSEAVLAAKVEQAERMMQSGMSLTDIADKLGYLNPSSFTRMFKKARGVAPSYYTGSQSL